MISYNFRFICIFSSCKCIFYIVKLLIFEIFCKKIVLKNIAKSRNIQGVRGYGPGECFLVNEIFVIGVGGGVGCSFAF